MVRLLIDAKAELNTADARGRAPLHCAVQKQGLDVVTSLLRAGVQFNTVSKIIKKSIMKNVTKCITKVL